MKPNKEEAPEEWIKEVYRIKHSEIPKGVTQCEVHAWVKLSENELKCTKCPTAIRVDDIKKYL